MQALVRLDFAIVLVLVSSQHVYMRARGSYYVNLKAPCNILPFTHALERLLMILFSFRTRTRIETMVGINL